jgi:DNA polymerase-3 subunit alpha
VDLHYLNAEDAEAHMVALAIGSNKRFGERAFNGEGYFYRTPRATKVQIKRTYEIAEKVEEYDLTSEKWRLPRVEVNEGEEYFKLSDRCHQLFGADERYLERLDYEWKVIQDNGFVSYFFIVASIYEEFRQRGQFVGWGRGSVSGSLVSYLYGITQVDPIKWGLYFERFLNPSRVTPPDIDMDFQPDDRGEAMEILGRFGSTVQIGTYGTLGTKDVLNAVSRACGVSTSLQSLVPNEAPVATVAELMKTEKFARQVEMEGNQEFAQTCMKLEGLRKMQSTHASGVVLTDDPLPVRIPRTGVNKGVPSTEWDMYSLEKLKYVKFDVLGVKNLEIIDRVLKCVGVRIEEVPLGDADSPDERVRKTYELINRCATVGVFQWESDGYKKIVRRLHPDTFEELLDLNTLYRPGCLESGITDQYIERKFGREPVVQLHPKLRMKRFGLPLYQEDIMEMARDVAGFTLTEADVLRKAIGKKEKESFADIHLKWQEGCERNGVSFGEAEDLWAKIEKFARYTWNKAHSVTYTIISWWTAFLSANYAEHFMCELLNAAESIDRRRVILAECRRRGVMIFRPHVNESRRDFVVREGGVQFGLSGIKYVGEKSLEAILEARDGHSDDCAAGIGGGCDCGRGPFADEASLKSRSRVNATVMRGLRSAGALWSETTPELESEYVGYTFGPRKIESVWWWQYVNGIAEIIDIHPIIDRRGQPMGFLTIEDMEDVRSVTVFSKLWAKLIFKRGDLGIFRINDDGVLSAYMPMRGSLEGLCVDVDDEDARQVFDLDGEANIFHHGFPIASVKLDEAVLTFMRSQFGIRKLWYK